MSIDLNEKPRAGGSSNFKSSAWPRKLDLFGLAVSATNYEEAVAAIARAALAGTRAVVSCQAVHGVVTFSSDEQLRAMANTFEMITPDGQPVRWALNLLHQAGLKDRVYGPELMLRVCRMAAETGLGVYLYGGTPEVAAQLTTRLKARFPGLQIVGAEAPPFRPLTPEEDQAVCERIRRSGAQLVFIGLGCPKQDRFADEHRERIRAVQICVGAAFDFHAGAKPMAPRWMQRYGLEWLFRFIQEPRRLAGRYLATNSIFLWKVLRALTRI
jgi:exopolysaccharide biosynthesis WecB/TagA/CpsF family protein